MRTMIAAMLLAMCTGCVLSPTEADGTAMNQPQQNFVTCLASDGGRIDVPFNIPAPEAGVCEEAGLTPAPPRIQ